MPKRDFPEYIGLRKIAQDSLILTTMGSAIATSSLRNSTRRTAMTTPIRTTQRSCVDRDLDYLYACYKRTMQQHVELAFGWDESLQRTGFLANARPADCTLLSRNEESIGFVWVQKSDRWTLRLICIEPEYQGHGIGTSCIRNLIDDARQNSKELTLRVFKSNRAIDLYLRLGLRVIGGDEHMHLLTSHA